MNTIISPSLLSADFANLERDVEMLNASQADWLHLDVMDGVFVPNISFGFPVIKAISKYARKPLDVHLMIVHPEKYIDEVKASGAYIMNVHVEACPHLHRVIQQIHAAGMLAGATLNPSTPVSMLEDVICDLDLALIMSVNPGFGGQTFIASQLEKISRIKQMIGNRKILIEVDGGINPLTGAEAVAAGADILVAGTSIFSGGDYARNIAALR